MIGHPHDAAAVIRKHERRTASALRASAVLIILGIAGVVFVGAHKPSLANELAGTRWVFKPDVYRVLLIGSWGLIVLAAFNAVGALARKAPDIPRLPADSGAPASEVTPANTPVAPASDVVPAKTTVAPPAEVPAPAATNTSRSRRAPLLGVALVIVVLLVIGAYMVGRTTHHGSAPRPAALGEASGITSQTVQASPQDAKAVAAAVGFAVTCQTIVESRTDRTWALASFTSPPPNNYCFTHDADGESFVHLVSGTWRVVSGGSSFSSGCPAGVPAAVLEAFAVACPR